MKKFKNRNGSDVYKKCLLGIEDFYKLVQAGTISDFASISTFELEKDSDYDKIRTYFKFLFVQYETKYTELTGALIDSVNHKEYMVFSLCGRSLIELTAILRYYIKKIQPILDESINTGKLTHEQQKQILSLLDQHARAGKFNWSNFYFGDRSEFAKKLVAERKKKPQKVSSSGLLEKNNPDQVNVQTAINQWAKKDAGVMLAYDFFCELVHPNLGSNFLVMGTKAKKLVVGKSNPKDIAKKLCDEGLPMIASTAIREASHKMIVLGLLSQTEDAKPISKNLH